MSLLSQCQNRIVGSGPKLELEGRSKNGTQKCEEDEKGDPEVEQEFQRYICARLYNVPHPSSAKDVVVELTGK